MLLALGGVSSNTNGNVSTATVSVSGGTLMSTDGSFSLDIPAGALSETRQITVTVDASPIGSIPQGYAKVTKILKFEPEGLVFSKPATLTINYEQGEMAEAGLEERSIAFYYIKDDSTLEKMKMVSIDYTQNKIRLEVEHFSFGVGLTIQVWLVNNGILTNPVPVLNIANNVIAELSSFASEGYGSVSAYFQAQSTILGPFLNKLVTYLGYDPISAAFPNEDFNGNGIPNSEDPFVASTGPVVSLVSSGSISVSNNAGAINTTQFVWQSTKSGNFTIRSGATNCTNGIVVTSGSVTAGANQTFGPLNASAMSLGTTSYRVCVINAGVTGAMVHSITRDDTIPTVSVNPASGSYGSVQNVALNCGDTGGAGCAAVAYTTNGNTPVFSSACAVTTGSLYITPIATPDSSVTTIKYKSCDKAGNVSTLYSQVYTVDSVLPSITINSVSPGTIIKAVNAVVNWTSDKSGSYSVVIGSSCGSGTLASGSNVSGSATGGVAVATTITAGTQLSDGSKKINVCVNNLVGNVGTSSTTLTIDSVAPSLSLTPAPGTYATPQLVTANCSDVTTTCQKVAYTIDGTDPAFDGSGSITNGSLYSGSLTSPNDAITTYKFIARDVAGNVSGISSAMYTVGNTTVALPSFSPAAGFYNTPQYITISTTTSGATIYFTTDGTTPTTSSNVYSAPIHIWSLAGKTVKAFAKKAGLSDSSVATLSGVYSYPPLKSGAGAIGGYTLISGEDGLTQIGVARSYTGPTAHATYTSDYTTTDNATGLVWKTCTQGLSGANCGTGTAVSLTWANASNDTTSGCLALNSANSGNGYAGIKTWRVPSRQELETLPDFGSFNPAINRTAFPGDSAASWTSTAYAPFPAAVYYLAFISGSMPYASQNTALSVRCVSGNSKIYNSNFTDNNDGTVKDNTTGLVWQKCFLGRNNDATCSDNPSVSDTATWANAITYCNELSFSSKTWRLPQINELKTIVDTATTTTPVIDKTSFPSTGTQSFWSSTTVNGYSAAWYVNFLDGYLFNIAKTELNSVRCVSGP
ncbi:chitobiase/beta-hexosaminidase C-terminal domain protein [Leptospira ryugenii]|uniref:Chitobiase/beta-hexosaminidase C-terminal domain protein n=2 Tax=Leptospira ryugenii TaxID=1917863 RepID=A0A2P2E2V6_9LEPT|nr:chitobiase/beta-hexosaminidase C-terminal domain protein [Leptospira ryugenii]